jgi:hypothetical protein
VHGNLITNLTLVKLWRNDTLIAQITVPNLTDTMQFVDFLPRPDIYRYYIAAVDTNSQMGRMLYNNENWLGGPIRGVVIWELDQTPITGSDLQNTLQELGFGTNQIYVSNTAAKYSLESTVDAVFVCLGIFPNNHQLSDEESVRLKNYLDAGGNVYMEGGDTWYFDPQTVVHPYFKINALDEHSL